ncbi:hypothetical protein ACIBI7_50565 [Nonomuraea fuscirosea]|uniref:hypothetical protein n=1 Tax=Nonomuraea fuscirosea TaxID=1291556 RepID=UPI0037A90129
MIDTRSITLTDAQWDLVLAGIKPGFTLDGFDSVQNIVIRAHDALRHKLGEDDPRRIDAISDMDVWAVADSRNGDIFLTVALAPRVALKSDLIDMVDIKATVNGVPGPAAARAVLTRLLAQRNEVCEAYVEVAVEFDGLVGYAEHRDVDPVDLFDDVHQAASEHASSVNNNGLAEQIPYLREQNGTRATRDLIDDIAARPVIE